MRNNPLKNSFKQYRRRGSDLYSTVRAELGHGPDGDYLHIRSADIDERRLYSVFGILRKIEYGCLVVFKSPAGLFNADLLFPAAES